VPKKNFWSITMVNPEQIAAKKYPRCSTKQSVSNFCSRYNVNRFWWRPPDGGKKIMMVDFQNFKYFYKDVYGTFPRSQSGTQYTTRSKKNWNTSTYSNRRTRNTYRTKNRRAA
jgi:hypothetical protein